MDIKVSFLQEGLELKEKKHLLVSFEASFKKAYNEEQYRADVLEDLLDTDSAFIETYRVGLVKYDHKKDTDLLVFDSLESDVWRFCGSIRIERGSTVKISGVIPLPVSDAITRALFEFRV